MVVAVVAYSIAQALGIVEVVFGQFQALVTDIQKFHHVALRLGDLVVLGLLASSLTANLGNAGAHVDIVTTFEGLFHGIVVCLALALGSGFLHPKCHG